MINPVEKMLGSNKKLGGLSKGVPDCRFNSQELKLGTKVEMREHGVSRVVAKSIAKDHLMKNANFYTKEKW